MQEASYALARVARRGLWVCPHMMSLPELSALIRARRSLKPAAMAAGREVDRPLVGEILTNAIWAPTHGLTQPWRFVVFSGDQRADLATQLQTSYRDSTPADQWRDDKFTKLGEQPLLAPVIVACVCVPDPTGKIALTEEIEATACAMQNAMLSATAAGLGSFWSSPPVLDSESFKTWLGFDANARGLGLLYLGYAKDDAPAPKSVRRPLDEVMRWQERG
jgi:nitroreductase